MGDSLGTSESKDHKQNRSDIFTHHGDEVYTQRSVGLIIFGGADSRFLMASALGPFSAATVSQLSGPLALILSLRARA